MKEYNEYFHEVISFITDHQKLGDCHLVDFLTEDLWNKCISDMFKISDREIAMYSNGDKDMFIKQNKFIQTAKSFSLSANSKVIDSKDISQIVLNLTKEEKHEVEKDYINNKVESMSEKKCYEVKILGQIVADIAKESDTLIIDAGAGKAYLSTYISENYGIPVLAIDSSKVCQQGAIRRQEKLKKLKLHKSSLVQYTVESIDNKTDYKKMVAFYFPNWKLNKNLILTGLHTCGSLANSLINAFLHTDDIRIMCIVPCCYHLGNETFNKIYNFSKNARMLAQQSIERTQNNKTLSPSLFYRAILQVFLHSIGIDNAKIGRGGPVNNFSTYANWALSKLNIKAEEIPPVHVLEDLYKNYLHMKVKFEIFQTLRIYFGSVIETAIILDRVVFLQEDNKCTKVNIVRVFDPMLSPRCYAIIATK